jgi:type I restriction enzyme, S subunit
MRQAASGRKLGQHPPIRSSPAFSSHHHCHSDFREALRDSLDSMQNIGQDTVRRVVLPLPPKAVQAQIIADCEWQQRRSRSISLRVRQQIGLLAERRQALITAAVTGRIEVPVAA